MKYLNLGDFMENRYLRIALILLLVVNMQVYSMSYFRSASAKLFHVIHTCVHSKIFWTGVGVTVVGFIAWHLYKTKKKNNLQKTVHRTVPLIPVPIQNDENNLVRSDDYLADNEQSDSEAELENVQSAMPIITDDYEDVQVYSKNRMTDSESTESESESEIECEEYDDECAYIDLKYDAAHDTEVFLQNADGLIEEDRLQCARSAFEREMKNEKSTWETICSILQSWKSDAFAHDNDVLYNACQYPRTFSKSLVSLLISHGLDANQSRDFPPLYLAVRDKNIAFFNSLLEHKADVSLRSKYGTPALYNALLGATHDDEYAKYVVLLFQHGARLDHIEHLNESCSILMHLSWKKPEFYNFVMQH